MGIFIDVVIGFILLLLICGCVYFIINFIGYLIVDEQYEIARVTNKYYTPESDSTSVGVAESITTGAQPVVTTSHQDAVFVIEYEYDDKTRERTDVSQDFFDEIDVGDVITIGYKISKWTKCYDVTSLYNKSKQKYTI